MSAPEVQPEQAGQEAQHPAQQALAALAEGGVEFDVQALLSSAPASPLNKEAAVLILFGVLDNSPSTGEFEGCPENVSADLDVLLLVRAATLRSHAGQPAFPAAKSTLKTTRTPKPPANPSPTLPPCARRSKKLG